MLRHSDLDTTQYAVAADLADCDPIDMTGFAGSQLFVNNSGVDKLEPYVCATKDGTYVKLYDANSYALQDPTINGIGKVCALNIPDSWWACRFLKLKCSTGNSGSVTPAPKS